MAHQGPAPRQGSELAACAEETVSSIFVATRADDVCEGSGANPTAGDIRILSLEL